MTEQERVAWWKPSNTAAKLLAAFVLLGVAQLLWAATRGRFDWAQYLLLACLAGAYLVAQGAAQRRFSWAQTVRMSLWATVLVTVGGVGFCIFMVFRLAQQPSADGREVVGFAILFGGFALLGLAMAVPYARRLLRLLHQEESEHS